MKLLFCFKCNDIVSLLREPRACRCGGTSGRYLEDDIHAEFTGDGCLLGISNDSFTEAIKWYKQNHHISLGFSAFVIADSATTAKRLG